MRNTFESSIGLYCAMRCTAQCALSRVLASPGSLPHCVRLQQADKRSAESQRLMRMQEQLQQAKNLQAQVGTWLAEAATHGEVVLELPDDDTVGNLPFVNGVLLGYPFTYCVTQDTVAAVSARLSCEELVVFRPASSLIFQTHICF